MSKRDLPFVNAFGKNCVDFTFIVVEIVKGEIRKLKKSNEQSIQVFRIHF